MLNINDAKWNFFQMHYIEIKQIWYKIILFQLLHVWQPMASFLIQLTTQQLPQSSPLKFNGNFFYVTLTFLESLILVIMSWQFLTLAIMVVSANWEFYRSQGIRLASVTFLTGLLNIHVENAKHEVYCTPESRINRFEFYRQCILQRNQHACHGIFDVYDLSNIYSATRYGISHIGYTLHRR